MTSRIVAAWERFWFAPTSTAPLAVLRIAFGLLMIAWTATLAPDLFTFFAEDGIVPQGLVPRDSLVFSPLHTFPGRTAIVGGFVALVVASIFLTIGLWTRVAAVVVFLGVMAFERRNPFVFNSGDLLIRNLSFFLVFAPSGAALSVDRLLSRHDAFWESPKRAPWVMRLIQIQVSALYFFAVWGKVRGTTWNDGTAVGTALGLELTRFPVPDQIQSSEAIIALLTYGTLVIELALAILVWNRRARPYVLALGVSLHVGIDLTLKVGFFSLAVVIAYLAFADPDAMDRRLARLRTRLTRIRPAGLDASPP